MLLYVSKEVYSELWFILIRKPLYESVLVLQIRVTSAKEITPVTYVAGADLDFF